MDKQDQEAISPPAPTDVEAKAIKQGWRPEEEYTGDPSAWVDAETFVERGEKIAAITKAKNDKLSSTLDSVRSELATMQKTFTEFQQYSMKAEERAYKKAISDLKAAQKEAVIDGDVARYDQISAEIDATPKPEVPSTDIKPQATQVSPEFETWVSSNQWYKTDQELSNDANLIYNQLLTQGRVFPTDTHLYNEVKKQVTLLHPDKFQQKRTPPSPVESDTHSTSQQPPDKKTFANLPPAAKAAYERFARSMPGYTKEQYLKNYEWE